MERRVHPIPFRTRQLSSLSPMILHIIMWESRSPPRIFAQAPSSFRAPGLFALLAASLARSGRSACLAGEGAWQAARQVVGGLPRLLCILRRIVVAGALASGHPVAPSDRSADRLEHGFVIGAAKFLFSRHADAPVVLHSSPPSAKERFAAPARPLNFLEVPRWHHLAPGFSRGQKAGVLRGVEEK